MILLNYLGTFRDSASNHYSRSIYRKGYSTFENYRNRILFNINYKKN